VTAEAAPGVGVVAAADAVLGAEAAVDAVLRATAVAWGAGTDAALGADETADIGIATSKFWRTCAKRERTDRGVTLRRVETCWSLADRDGAVSYRRRRTANPTAHPFSIEDDIS
jgi:hypothetical protein